jgi:hypothetical protein
MSASTEIVPYGGWTHNLRIFNPDVELVVTLEVGPRVIRYAAIGGRNLLGEAADQLGRSGEPAWMARGGHRLWTAPEHRVRTYVPDNAPVQHAMVEGVAGHAQVRVTEPPDPLHGIQKEIDIGLGPSGSEVVVVHRITNIGKTPVSLAAWALTVMPPGGTAIVPLPPKVAHPGTRHDAPDADYWPNQNIALWSYTDFKDPRLDLGTRFVTLRQDPRFTSPLKIGLSHDTGWLGYWRAGDLFVKSVEPQRGRSYPDRGCNFEGYVDGTILEVETIGPLVTLAPGEQTEHGETWHLYGEVGPVGDEESIARNVLPRLAGR